jgi:hypothetical protein
VSQKTSSDRGYAYARNNSTVVSGDLYAIRAKAKFKNGYDAEHNSITSEAVFQTRQKRLKSDYIFK